jgi:serine/threonine protein kinase
MAVAVEPNREFLPGYRLLELLGKGGFGEVWKCEAPGGLYKAVKLIRRDADLDGSDDALTQELKDLHHNKAIRHPYILSLERIETVGGELVIVMELADKSLRDLLAECRAAGRPGIPREALLGYMREAAEALDVLNLRHGVQHLDVKPDNLFLVSDHVKVADFGLADTAQAAGPREGTDPSKGITPLYAAPERFRGIITASSDQYSLALVYQELLTGGLPFRGKNRRQLLLQHTNKEPDLSLLPAADRPAVARALAKDPGARFPSCTEFIRALGAVVVGPDPGHPPGGGAMQNAAGPSDVAVTLRVPGSVGPEGRGAAPHDTARGKSTRPDLPRVPAAGRAAGGPLPGYEFLDCLGQSPFGDLWRVRAPDGRLRMAQYVYGFADGAGPQEEALGRLTALRHRALLRVEAAHGEGSRLILVTDLPEQTLWDRHRKCRADGLPGIPRDELLGWMRAAAETLDDLAEDHGLRHLALNPRNLVLHGRRLQVADFGLVQLLWSPAGKPVGPLNGRYAAPELFRQPTSGGADVYSLALIYQELLTGFHPLGRLAARRSAQPRGEGAFDLDPLPPSERAVVARALDSDPRQRFATCAGLVDALESAAAGDGEGGGPDAGEVDAVAAPGGPVPAPPFAEAEPVLSALVTAAQGPWQACEHENVRYLLLPGEEAAHRCLASLLPAFARLKLEGYFQEWGAELVRSEGEQSFVFQWHAAQGFWRRWLGGQPGLTIQVGLRRVRETDFLTEVAVQIKPSGCDRKEGARLLQEAVPPLLAGLRSYLQASPELRAQERLPCDHPLHVQPVLVDASLGEAIPGRTRDVSLAGMGLVVEEAPESPQVCIHLPGESESDGVAALAEVKHVRPCEAGGYEIGVQFVRDASDGPQPPG